LELFSTPVHEPDFNSWYVYIVQKEERAGWTRVGSGMFAIFDGELPDNRKHLVFGGQSGGASDMGCNCSDPPRHPEGTKDRAKPAQITEKEREQEEEITKLNLRVEELESAESGYASRIEELESTESEYASRIEQLEELVGDLRDKVRFAEERSSECENLRSENWDLQSKVSDLKDKVRYAEERSSECGSLRSENWDLQSQVNAFKAEKSYIEGSRSWRNVEIIETKMVSCPRNEIDYRTPISRRGPLT
jgi:hypothetical protein